MLRPGPELTSALLSDLGIGIFCSAPRQHHIAFVYQASDGAILVSHLRTHRQFYGKDPWDPRLFWTSLTALGDANRKFCSSWLEALDIKPIEVAYGFSDAGCRFTRDEAGKIVFVNVTAGKGLTCATFIIVVLESLGFEPLVRDSWPSRDDDKEWQSQILQELKDRGLMGGAELDLLSEDIGSVRFRPIEVAAACDRDGWPVTFAEAAVLAEQILAAIPALRFLPAGPAAGPQPPPPQAPEAAPEEH